MGKALSRRSVSFLRDLRENNNKGWFEAHRDEYREHLLEPLQEIVERIGGFMLAIDPALEVSPRRAVSRIHRDTRFSRDKSPYRTSLWVTFKRPRKEWINAPSFFFEISAESYRYGMGFYSADRTTIDRLRESAARKPAAFRDAIAFQSGSEFAIEGDRYRKPPPAGIPEELAEWLWRKNLYVACNRPVDDRLFTSITGDLAAGYATLVPLYEYLRKVSG